MFYANPEVVENDKANKTIATINMLESHRMNISNKNTNTCQSQEIKSSSIPYLINQLSNSNLWDSTFFSVFIFRANEFINIDTNKSL